MYLLIVLDALGSFSINVKQHEINWTNFRQQLIFLSFTVLYMMPINKRNACHKYTCIIYIKRGSNMIIN